MTGRTGSRGGRPAREPYAWLGVGTLALGLGAAALAGGAGNAHADATGGRASAHSAAHATRSAAHPAAAHVALAHAATATPRHAVSAPVVAARTPTTGHTAAANPTLSPVPPLGVVAKLIGSTLLTLGGMDPANPTPNPKRPLQGLLYGAAAVIENTFNPKGIPLAGTPIIGRSDPVTASVTVQPVFTDAQTATLITRVTGDPTQGTVTVSTDGLLIYTPNDAARLNAFANGDTTDSFVVTSYNGVQSKSQTIVVPISHPQLQVRYTIPNPGVVDLAVTPDGKKVVTANYGAQMATVIDTQTRQVTYIPVAVDGNGQTLPSAVTIAADSLSAYVSDYKVKAVSKLDLVGYTVGPGITVGSFPEGVSLGRAGTPSAGKLYVANQGDNTVSVLDTTTGQVTKTISVSTGPSGVTVSPDGARAYVPTAVSKISVINTATNAVVATISTLGTQPVAIAFSPNGSRAYAADYNTDTLDVIDTATNTAIAKITVGTPVGGSGASGVAVSPDGSVVYVSDMPAHRVVAINTATNAVITTLNVGTSPEGLMVSPDGHWLYVANHGDGTVSMIGL